MTFETAGLDRTGDALNGIVGILGMALQTSLRKRHKSVESCLPSARHRHEAGAARRVVARICRAS